MFYAPAKPYVPLYVGGGIYLPTTTTTKVKIAYFRADLDALFPRGFIVEVYQLGTGTATGSWTLRNQTKSTDVVAVKSVDQSETVVTSPTVYRTGTGLCDYVLLYGLDAGTGEARTFTVVLREP
jgi:hypothetical protein